MRKKRRVLYVAFLLILVVTAFTAAQAATSAQPGSEFDPLVTKSYVDEQIQLLTNKIGTGTPSTGGTNTGANTGSSTGTGTVDEQVLNNIRTDVRDLINLTIDAFTRIDSLERQNIELIRRIEALEQGFVVVELSKGQKIILGAGSEILVRSGETTAISGELGGLADVTSAQDLTNGMRITNQHLLLSSRADGRGVFVASDKAFFLIRGSYTVE
ncbi:MAG: hypothetical protein PHC69_12520 [Ruminiclostridium sp.]|nr:hypothetical protein [Ruminiclostridium sp.]